MEKDEKERVEILRQENKVWAIEHGLKPFEEMTLAEQREEEAKIKADLIKLCRE